LWRGAGLAAKSDHRRVIGRVDRHQFGAFADTGIAGGRIEARQLRRLGNFPRKRVLAAARTDKEYVHFPSSRAAQRCGALSKRGAMCLYAGVASAYYLLAFSGDEA
jgi:hypothetical protein